MSHTFIPAVHVMMIRDNKVLLLKRRKTGYMDGWYCLPCGEVKDGEKLAEAAARKANEQAGVIIRPGDLRLAHVMRRYAPGNDRIEFFYETTVWESIVTIGNPDMHDEVIWVNMDYPPEKTIPYVFDFIRYCYPKVFLFSELGWGKDRVPKKITEVTWF